MLDLSCIYTGKKCKVTIDKDLKMDVDGDMQPTDHIGVVSLLKTTAEKYRSKNIFKQSFDEVVKDVKLVESLKEMACSIRCTHLRIKAASKEKEEIRSFFRTLFYDSKYCGKADKAGFSMGQKIVIFDLTDKYLFSGVSSEDFIDKYLPISQKRDKVAAFYEELKSFPYGEYGDNEGAILNKIRLKFEKANRSIDAVELIVNEAKEDIVNWTGHKISRKLNEAYPYDKYGDNSQTKIARWKVESIIGEVKEHYLKKGIEVAPIKPKKAATGIRLLASFRNGEELTQDELVTVFKQTVHGEDMISKMTLETMLSLMESELKTVKEKLFNLHRDNTVYGLEKTGRNLLIAATELCKTETEFNRVRNFATIGKASLPWEFIFKFMDYFTSEEVIKQAKVNSMGEIPAEFYDKHLVHLDNETLVTTNNAITKEFVSRLSNEDKIAILPFLGGDFKEQQTTNSMMAILSVTWMDQLQRIRFDGDDLFELYKDVSWKDIKSTVSGISTLKAHAVDLAILNKDLETAALILKEHKVHLSQEDKLKLLTIFKEESRYNLIMQTIKSGHKYLLNCYASVLSKESVLRLFSVLIKGNDLGFIDDIILSSKSLGIKVGELRDIIKSIDDIPEMDITAVKVNILDKETKLHLLRTNCKIKASETISHHSGRTTGFNPYLQKFFGDLDRKELEQVLRENLVSSHYRLYLCHAMTPNEKGLASEIDKSFLKFHVEEIPYKFLAKYEDKKLFKELVGDRRDRSNNWLALSLETMFKKNLEKQINPANTIKVMFAS